MLEDEFFPVFQASIDITVITLLHTDTIINS